MKKNIHPNYENKTFSCVGCGASFTIPSTVKTDMQIGVCSNCHPHYTGRHRFVDTAGRVERFRQKYGITNEQTQSVTKR